MRLRCHDLWPYAARDATEVQLRRARRTTDEDAGSVACGRTRATEDAVCRLLGPSEGDVVVPAAASTARGSARVVGGVGRDVAAGAEAVAAAVAAPGAVARAEELDRVGDDFHALALAALFVLPLTPVEAAFDCHGPAFGEVVGAVLALGAPDGDVEVVRLVDPVAALVLAPAVDRHAQLADRGAARRAAQLGVSGQVPGDDHHVDVRSRHGSHSSDRVVRDPSLRVGAARLFPFRAEYPQKEALRGRLAGLAVRPVAARLGGRLLARLLGGGLGNRGLGRSGLRGSGLRDRLWRGALALAGDLGRALARGARARRGGRRRGMTGVSASTLKMRKRSTPSAIFRLWSSCSSSSVGASKRNQR